MEIVLIIASSFLTGIAMFAFYKKRLADANKAWNNATKAKHEANEAKLRLDNLINQKNIESTAKELKNKVFADIENRHRTLFPYHAEMGVSVSSLKEKMGYKEDEFLLEQVLSMLYREGKLTFDQTENQYVHRI